MKKTATMTALAALLAAPAVSLADGWTFLAGTKPGYTAKPAVSLMLGQMSPNAAGASSGTITGVEFSLNCPLLQPPSNRIRQQVSLTQYDEGGGKQINVEINPHYIVEVMPGLEVGGGPGLGYINTDADSGFGVQLGLSAHYTALGPAFIGAEWRYQLAVGSDTDLDNSRFAVKLGYAF